MQDSTNATYYNLCKNFNEFFIRLDKKPESWEDRLALFLNHLTVEERNSETLRSCISAVRNVLSAEGIELNKDSYRLSVLIKTCKI